MNKELIGLRLRTLRTGANLTQQELAERLGLSDAAIGMYESGERVPKDEIKIRYAEFFGKTVQEIFFDNG